MKRALSKQLRLQTTHHQPLQSPLANPWLKAEPVVSRVRSCVSLSFTIGH